MTVDGAKESEAKVSESELAQARRLLSATAIRALAEDRWQKYRPWLDWPLFVVCIAVLAVLFGPGTLSTHAVPPLDSISTTTVRAERDFLIEDKEATGQRRTQAAQDALPVFDYDPSVYPALIEQVRNAVLAMTARKSGSLDANARSLAFQQDIGLPVRVATFDLIEGLSQPGDLTEAVSFFLAQARDALVTADRNALPMGRGVMIHDTRHDATRVLTETSDILDVPQLRRNMLAKAGDAPYGEARQLRRYVLDTAYALARPNLVLNGRASEAARNSAAAAVEPVYVKLAAGEVIVREGDRVTQPVQDRIRLLNEGAERRTLWGEIGAFALMSGALILLSGWYFRRRRHPNWPSRKEAYLTLSIAVASAMVVVAVYIAGRGVGDGLGLDRHVAGFLPPIALASVLVAVLVGARASLLAGLVLSLLMAYRIEGHVLMASYYAIGVLLGGITARKCRRRGDLLRAGIAIGLVQAALSPLVLLLDEGTLGLSALAAAGAAFMSGGFAAIAAMGLLPVFEHIFEETTDMRLIELASADNPLLKQLALQSPGTFYHSVMMSNLAEAAADAIGANGLQCRVMALYHDLGKMLRPNYFAENQRGGNIHDRLPPELSARIIFAHIKDGIDIARKYRLGRPILDAITQHQGTTLLRVFYLKALERAKATGTTVDESEFRYPGPRPRTRESGVLLMADSAEAATRALKDPSPAELTERVHKVIGEKLADGQLDSCELTMRDIARIETAFVRVLTLGVYHSRIEYPPMPQQPPGGPSGVASDHDPSNRHPDRKRGLGERAS
ncbi:MAG TPA: HDIG domain-containing protein [Candidatus Cybelea sp.]|nr:HDIG domain-containing protein [Candidatus Cybelea sp.]